MRVIRFRSRSSLAYLANTREQKQRRSSSDTVGSTAQFQKGISSEKFLNRFLFPSEHYWKFRIFWLNDKHTHLAFTQKTFSVRFVEALLKFWLDRRSPGMNAKLSRFKGALSRISSISLNMQPKYIFVSRETYTQWPSFVNNCYISTLKLLASVFGCRWRGWKRIAPWKIEAKLFKLFPRVFK